MKTFAFLFLMTLGLGANSALAQEGPPPPRAEVAVPTCNSSIQALLTTSRMYQKEIDLEPTQQCADVGNCGMAAQDEQAQKGRDTSIEKLRAELEKDTVLTEELCSSR